MTGVHAEWFAAGGAIVAAIVAMGVWVQTYQGRLRAQARDALIEFTSSDIARARDSVASRRRARRLNGRDRRALRRDGFTLLWALKRFGVVRDVLNSAIAPDDLALLYRHVDAVVAELQPVVLRHATLGCFRETAERATLMLDQLHDVPRPWGFRRKGTRPALRLPATSWECPKVSELR